MSSGARSCGTDEAPTHAGGGGRGGGCALHTPRLQPGEHGSSSSVAGCGGGCRRRIRTRVRSCFPPGGLLPAAAAVTWLSVQHALPAAVQCFYNQSTYAGHVWRLRDAADGSLLAECAAAAGGSTLTLLPSGGVRHDPGLQPPPPARVTDARWGTYRQRGAACGIPVLAFDCVSQAAVRIAEHIIQVCWPWAVGRAVLLACAVAALPALVVLTAECATNLHMQSMLQDACTGVVEAMRQAGATVALIGRDQVGPQLYGRRGAGCRLGMFAARLQLPLALVTGP